MNDFVDAPLNNPMSTGPSEKESQPFRIKSIDGKRMILDMIRHKYVVLTPEEWVRQNLIRHLIEKKGYPRALISVETRVNEFGVDYRADVIAYDRNGKAILMAECKAGNIRLSENSIEQITKYNRIVRASVILITNGMSHLCWKVAPTEASYEQLPRLPDYDQLIEMAACSSRHERSL